MFLIVKKYMDRWYIASGWINGRMVAGFGDTHMNALLDAFNS
jgi:hypothetical protein